jgi:DNA repair photolyase
MEGCDADKRCAARLERMMRSIHAELVHRVTCEELDRLVAGQQGRLGLPGRPAVIFSASQWRSSEEERRLQERYPHLAGNLRLAWGANVVRMGTGAVETPLIGTICRPFWDTDPMIGCYHACTYCTAMRTGCLAVTLNVEQLVERHEAITRCAPWQRHWHTGGATDIFCFEPEYGFTELILDSAARLDKYVLFYTSSDNVEFILNMKHRERAIIEWTISPEALTRFEAKAPSLKARLRAMQLCRDAGCVVRCQFAPFVPLAGWRDHYRGLIRELFAAVELDMIAIHMLRCPQPASSAIRQWFGRDSLDPEYVALIEGAERGGNHVGFPGNHIFPYDARAVMNRFVIEAVRNTGSDVPIALCRETPEMWAEFRDSLRLSPELCGCGCPPKSVRTQARP